jgi:predicted metal-binding membrane protein
MPADGPGGSDRSSRFDADDARYDAAVVALLASLYTRSFGADRRVRLAAFTAGYLIVWMLAAIPAYALAWLAGRLSGTHPGAATGLAVAVCAACGAYQLTGLKERCLSLCRSPLGLAIRLGGYRGKARDLRAGLYHGWFCLACCWALMALLVALASQLNVCTMVVLAATVRPSSEIGPGPGQPAQLPRSRQRAGAGPEPGIAPGLHEWPAPG